MANVNSHIFDRGVRHLIGLERLENGLARDFIKTLRLKDKAFLKEFSSGLAEITSANLTKRQLNQALTTLERSLRVINTEAYAGLLEHINSEFVELVGYEANFTKNMTTDALRAFGVKTPEFQDMAKTKAEYIVANHLVVNETVAGWVHGMQDARLNAIMRTVKNGIIEDETFNEIYRRVNGKKGDMFKAMRSVETFTRTGVTSVTTAGRGEFLNVNQKYFKGEQWISVLDGRTSPVCQSRAGNVYPIGIGPRPPAHFKCRSVTVPVSQDSPPAEKVNYGDWIVKQPVAIQNEALGITRAKLLRKGGLSHEKLFKRDDQFITLKELKTRESSIFDKAGL